MGEYAELYTLEQFGVDISESTRKTKWKWACHVCKKNLASKLAQRQHLHDKHGIIDKENKE